MVRSLRARLMPALAASVMVVGAMASPAFTATAQASVATTTHPIPGGLTKTGGVTPLCYDQTGYSCTKASGYNGTLSEFGTSGWGAAYWSSGSSGPTPTTKHNCTTYAAYRLLRNGYGYPGWANDATQWAADAANPKLRGSKAPAVKVDQTPVVGSIAQWNLGHVAYVEAVTSTYIVTTSDNFSRTTTSIGTDRLRILRTSPYMPDNFIHFRDTYIGGIVQWNLDTKPQKTAWRVGKDGMRHWIPSTSVYSCLVHAGVTSPYVLPESVLDTVVPLRDGSWASCGGDLNGDGKVNVLDLSILESEWGTSGHLADINLDGIVNAADLSILESQYGKTPTAVLIPPLAG